MYLKTIENSSFERKVLGDYEWFPDREAKMEIIHLKE